MRIGAGIAMAAALAACVADPGAPACDFDCSVAAIVEASQGHDWDTFEALITISSDIRLVEPYGPVREGRDAYIDALYGAFHDEAPTSLDYQLVGSRQGSELGFALFDVTMRVAEQDEPWRYHQLMILALEEGEWRLVHDQITAVDSNPGAFAEEEDTETADEEDDEA